LTKHATLKSPSLFSKITDQQSYFTPSDEDDEDFIPEELCKVQEYDDNEIFQDDKEEDLVDLSYYRSPTKHGVGHKLNKGGPPKPDVTNMNQIKQRWHCKSGGSRGRHLMTMFNLNAGSN
jgi:hypothetical protein